MAVGSSIVYLMKITRPEWKALSTLCSNFSAVFLASLVLPIFTAGFDISNWYVLVLGLALTIFFSWLTIASGKKGKL